MRKRTKRPGVKKGFQDLKVARARSVPRVGVEPVIDEVYHPGVRKIRFVADGNVGWNGHTPPGLAFPLLVELDILEDAIFIDVDVDLHGIHGDDGGQDAFRPRARLDEITGFHPLFADPAVDRRADFREFQVQLGRGVGRLCHPHRGLGLLQRRHLLVVFTRGNGVFRAQVGGTLEIQFTQLQSRLGALQFAGRPIHLRLIRARVDDEEQVVFLHQGVRPRRKLQLLNIAGHPRPNVDGLRGLHSARESVPFDDFLLHRHDHIDRKRSWRRRRRLFVTTGQSRSEN